jgi:hypothetical protein
VPQVRGNQRPNVMVDPDAQGEWERARLVHDTVLQRRTTTLPDALVKVTAVIDVGRPSRTGNTDGNRAANRDHHDNGPNESRSRGSPS